MLPGFDFDHSKTKYPLQGKHAQVACTACHLNGDFKKQLPFANCKDCHTPDPHKGQFESRPQKGRMRRMPHGGWLEAIAIRRERARQFALPAEGEARTGGVREVPHPGGQGHDLQGEVRQPARTATRMRTTTSLPLLRTTTSAKTCHTVSDLHRTTYHHHQAP